MGGAGAATGVAETIIDKGPSLLEALGKLDTLLAFGVLLVVVIGLFMWAWSRSSKRDKESTIETMEVLSDRFVDPITAAMDRNEKHQEQILTNHFHDEQQSRAQMAQAFDSLTDRIKHGLDVLADKPDKG